MTAIFLRLEATSGQNRHPPGSTSLSLFVSSQLEPPTETSNTQEHGLQRPAAGIAKNPKMQWNKFVGKLRNGEVVSFENFVRDGRAFCFDLDHLY